MKTLGLKIDFDALKFLWFNQIRMKDTYDLEKYVIFFIRNNLPIALIEFQVQFRDYEMKTFI